MIKHLLASALCLLFVFFVVGQETTSEILGTVSDGRNSLGGATVVAIHTPSGTAYSTTTRQDGRYNLPNLRIGGPYLVTVTYIGFKKEHQDSIILILGQDYKADFKLTTESKELTEVTITAAGRQGKVFNTSHTGSQEIINRTQIERLPTINRSLQDFTKLTPSANGLSFGGRSSLYNNVTVDGANFNNAFGLSSTLGGQTNSQPISLDAIEQIQVNISPYDVRQGGFSGAGINSVTRSGTNKFRGTVYTYLKGPGTLGYDVGSIKVPRQSFEYNLRGASIGGPIIQNKLFFFISGESERRTDPATSFIASDANHPVVQGGNVSNANADTLNALKQFLIDTYKYNPGNFQGYSYKTYSDKLTVKIDWNINHRNTFTIKYNYLKSHRDVAPSNSGAPGGNRQPGINSLPFNGTGYQSNNNFNIIIAELNTRFTNKASNKLQVGYSALRDFRTSLGGGDFPLVDIMNGQGQSYTSFGYEPFTYHNLLSSDIYQVSDIFTFYKGSHEITIGTQDYYKKFKNGFAPNYEGNYRFNTLTDFYNSAKNGVANSLQYQLQYSAEKGGVFPFAYVGVYELGFFAQDKWRVNNNFTLTYGLRIDAPVFKDQFETNDNAKNLIFRDGQQYDVGQKPGTNLLISPRLGFNWDITGDQKTQFRGGVGLFAGPPPFVYISNQASNNGVQFGSFTSNTPYAFNPDINAYRPAAGAANTSYNLVFTDHNFKYPQVLKASLAIDRKLPWDIIVTLEGTYSKEINAVYFQNVNLPQTGITLAGSDPRIRYDSTRIHGGHPTATATNPNITNSILMKNSNKGYAYTLTLQLQKNFRNVYLNVAYTYSKAKSLNDGGSIAASTWRDRPVSGDPNAEELGFANFYQPHRLIASVSYRKEYAKYFATSIGLIYEVAPSGVGSYTYNGDVNNDGTGGNNDLIYIPKDQSDIVLVPVNNGNPVNGITDTRTPDAIWAQLNSYIIQDKYLNKHRGQVAQRNAVIFPYFKRLDMNITQDFYMYIGKGEHRNKHTLRVSMDMINLGNFLNKNWGITKTFNSGTTTIPYLSSILKYEGLTADKHPKYSFPYLVPASQTPLTKTFKDDTSNNSFTNLPNSRWQMQIGIRYLFN